MLFQAYIPLLLCNLVSNQVTMLNGGSHNLRYYVTWFETRLHKYLMIIGCHHDNAVSLYYLEIPNFSLLEEEKVFKNNVRDIYSASPTLCILFIIKISCVPVCTMFLS